MEATNKRGKKVGSRKFVSPLTSSLVAGDRNNKRKNNNNGNRSGSRKSRKSEEEEQEERELTALLFGGEGDNENINSDNDSSSSDDSNVEEQERNPKKGEFSFEIDRTGSSSMSANYNLENDDDDNDDEGRQAIIIKKKKKKVSSAAVRAKAAWVDEEDEDINVNLLGTDRLRKLRKSRSEATAGAIDGMDYQNRLRHRYRQTAQSLVQTQWANPKNYETSINDPDESEQEEENNWASSSAPLLVSPSSSLKSSSSSLLSSSKNIPPPNILSVIRCPDANQSDYNQAVVRSVHFHPLSDPDTPLLLTAGLDKTLRFFQVSSEGSTKVHGIHFPKLPIYFSSFIGDSDKVIVTGRRKFFYVYDSMVGKLDFIPRINGGPKHVIEECTKSLETCCVSPPSTSTTSNSTNNNIIAFGCNDGYIILMDSKSKHYIGHFKMNGSIRTLTFTPDGKYLLASGSDGDIYRFDIHSRRCIERFSNQDGTITSSLSCSFRRLAVGAESGVVNLYDSSSYFYGNQRQQQQQQQNKHKNPVKSIMNLHTSADLVKFNHDGNILAISTQRDKHNNNNQMKLVHVPTNTVFSNWPTSKTPLNYVFSMDFSPQSKFMVIGNDQGKALLYQLMHYHHNDS